MLQEAAGTILTLTAPDWEITPTGPPLSDPCLLCFPINNLKVEFCVLMSAQAQWLAL